VAGLSEEVKTEKLMLSIDKINHSGVHALVKSFPQAIQAREKSLPGLHADYSPWRGQIMTPLFFRAINNQGVPTQLIENITTKYKRALFPFRIAFLALEAFLYEKTAIRN